MPLTQSVHTALELACTVVENLPAGHWVQVEEFVTAVYVPARHGVQMLAPELEKVPARHAVQTDDAVPPVVTE